MNAAVTLEGTIIHKSGLITGGRSTHSSKKWDEKDVQGSVFLKHYASGKFADDQASNVSAIHLWVSCESLVRRSQEGEQMRISWLKLRASSRPLRLRRMIWYG